MKDMKNRIFALVICVSLLCSVLCACSSKQKAGDGAESSIYKMKISVDVISESQKVAIAFQELDTLEADIRVGDTVTYIHYSSNPYTDCYEQNYYWISGGYILYRYVTHGRLTSKTERLQAKPTEEELNLFLHRATFFGGVTEDDFGGYIGEGDTLTYTNYRGARDGYLRDIVYIPSSWLAGENDFYGEDITLTNMTLSVKLDSKDRPIERVLLCDYKVLAAGVEYEFTLKATMTYELDVDFDVMLPDDYFDGKFTILPYDEDKFAYLRMTL